LPCAPLAPTNTVAHYLYRLLAVRPAMLTEGTTDEEADIIRQHFDYLTALAEEGTMLLFGRTANNDYSTMGIAIFKAESEEAARKIMEDDPAVKNRVMRAELYPYRIAGLSIPALEEANDG
jgi:uncharacterized protein